MVNGYHKISLFNHEILVPHAPLREDVEVHLIPDIQRDAFEVRIWGDSRMVQSLTYPLKEFPGIHFSKIRQFTFQKFLTYPAMFGSTSISVKL